jgi:hypothetical protein
MRSIKPSPQSLADALTTHGFGSPTGKGGNAPPPLPLDRAQFMLNWDGAGSSPVLTDEYGPELEALRARGSSRRRDAK